MGILSYDASCLLGVVLCSVVVSSGLVQAAPINPGVARQVAERWIARNAVFASATEPVRVVGVRPLAFGDSTTALLYHVSLVPHGYLVLGADDRLPPVLAFSEKGDLVLEGKGPNGLRSLLSRETSSWRAALKQGSFSAAQSGAVRAAVARHQSQWRELASETQLAAATEPGSPEASASAVVVAPMLQTQWSQWNHFNELYPADPSPVAGYDGRAPVGCMPVAAAQVGRFFAWPPRGDGGHTDDDTNPTNLIAGPFGARFLDPFNWSATQVQYNPWGTEPQAAVTAVSDILYRFGVALNLDYGSFNYGGSSASLQALSRAMNRCFFYERGTFTERAGNAAAFDSTLRNEVIAGRPVICAIPGHAVVVDGLSVDAGVDYYHLNYGLAGQNDGWYQPSVIPEGSVTAAIFGQWPALIPVLQTVGVTTNVSGLIDLAWSVAAVRQSQVDHYRVREGRFVATNFSDSASNLQEWTDYSAAWKVESPGRSGGTCFRKVAEIGDYTLAMRNVLVPSAATVLQFDYKAILVQDHMYLQISTDRGVTWTTLRHLTNTGWDPTWRTASVALGGYAGREVAIRFLYSFSSGSHYGINGGFWLDNVALNGIQQLQWSVLADHLAAGSTRYQVGTRLSGTQHFDVQAYDGATWSAASPFVSVTVALDPALDVDGDGLANGWEQAYFGSATGGVATVDSDQDGLANQSEFVAGTDPLSAASRLAVAGVDADVAQPVVSWPSVAGKTYTLWRATGLGMAFQPVVSNLVATPPQNTYTDTSLPVWSTAFYRVSVP
ncbi:MAG: C10 family peptidase [Lentisphaerae bacterium]|nr:C10 family peptidase [Lentisphaerota bacterium]